MSPTAVITLTTDFGTEDPYVGVMKGVILGLAPEARLVDLTHRVPPQDVTRAAWVLHDAAPHFPPGTIHLVVVDPGVGSERRPVALSRDGHLFVGPDNGVFSAFLPADQAVVLDKEELFRRPVSRTFHGRDVFAPIAARLAAGWKLEQIGSPVTDLATIELPRPVREGESIRGQVIHVDRFGNLITNLTADLIPDGANVTARIAGTEIAGLQNYYGERAAGEFVLLTGSSGRIEIAVTNGHAADRLPAGGGSEVILRLSSRSKE